MKPIEKTIVARPVVKIQLPGENENRGAVIYSQDRSIDMPAALSMAKKRLKPGETFGYFKSELDDDGVLEIGDRVKPDPNPPW